MGVGWKEDIPDRQVQVRAVLFCSASNGAAASAAHIQISLPSPVHTRLRVNTRTSMLKYETF